MGWQEAVSKAGAVASAAGEGIARGARGGAAGAAGGIEATLARAQSLVDRSVKETQQDLLDKQRKVRPRLGTPQETGTISDPSVGDTSSTARSLRKGGRVKKTAVYRLHKGEFVVPADVVKRLDKTRKGTRKSGRR